MNRRKVVGTILIACGVIVALYGVWTAWGENEFYALTQSNAAAKYHSEPQSTVGATSSPDQVNGKKFLDAAAATHLGDVFAKMYVPRFGKNWSRLVGEGVKWHPVLNEIGVGHYPSSQLPGEVGNFAVAGHRGGFGGAFLNIHRLTKGDHVYLETNAGWFSYTYLQTKIVKPADVDVIGEVPKELTGHVAGERYMTMTSCTPVYVNTNRIIVWLKLDEVRTLEQGPPAEIADSVDN